MRILLTVLMKHLLNICLLIAQIKLLNLSSKMMQISMQKSLLHGVKISLLLYKLLRSERDWEKIRTIEKEELFEQHNAQLQEYIRLGRINCIERINVNQAFLHKYVRDENFEHLTVCMKVRMIDYIIDEKSGKLLKGSKDNDVYDISPYIHKTQGH